MFIAKLALLCSMILCYTGQDFFKKMYTTEYTGTPFACASVFSILYGVIVAAATFVYNGCTYTLNTATLILGIINGVNLFIFNLSVIRALQLGPLSFQTLMCVMGGLLIPLVCNIFYWGDELTVVQIIGVVFLIITFIFYSGKNDSDIRNKKYLMWVFINALSNGAYGVLMDAQNRIATSAMRNEMIITVFIASALTSAIYFIITSRKEIKTAFKMTKHGYVFAALSSVSAAIAINLLMFTMSMIPSKILLPTQMAGVLMFELVLSVIILHERIKKRQAICIALALVGMTLLNI